MKPLCRLTCAVIICLVVSETTKGEDLANLTSIESRLKRGEYTAANEKIERLPKIQRDRFLAQVAADQLASGDRTAAATTARRIQSAEIHQDATNGNAGGSSFADFQSLIDLIQTTVTPDTWDVLGGPSTMREYPQGVYVDPNGTLLPCETAPATDSLSNLALMLGHSTSIQSGHDQQWLAPSPMRCVSLRRLRDAWTASNMLGIDPDESLIHVAGLTEIRYVMLSGDDLVIAGPVGGIRSHQGWHRDMRTGMTTLRLDFLSTVIASMQNREAFGCTIDPTSEGLQNAASVAAKVQSKQLPIGKAADGLIAAIGMQRIEVFGTPADTPIGLMMVEADRHMKQLALGIEPMPGQAKNYLDVVDDMIAQGPPNELLLRLWFTANRRRVRSDAAKQVFELSGVPIRLSGQNQRAMANGDRGNRTQDPRTDAFVKQFNEHWIDVRTEYPIYASLESIYQAASIAAVVGQHAKTVGQSELLDSLAMMSSTDAEPNRYVGTRIPKQVETIAVLHRARLGKLRHNVVIASGGVAVSPLDFAVHGVTIDPALTSYANVSRQRPIVLQSWWWDAGKE